VLHEGPWCHLECVPSVHLSRFGRPCSRGTCSAIFGGKCVPCKGDIVPGEGIKASWMGWIHQVCEADPLDRIMSGIRMLQAHCDAHSMTMPTVVHSWQSLEEFEGYVNDLEEFGDCVPDFEGRAHDDEYLLPDMASLTLAA